VQGLKKEIEKIGPATTQAMDAQEVKDYTRAVAGAEAAIDSMGESLEAANKATAQTPSLFRGLGAAAAGALAGIGIAAAASQLRDLQAEINATRGRTGTADQRIGRSAGRCDRKRYRAI
jgi:hypothetical protein